MEKQNRTRNIQMLFRVTPQEKAFIREKMRLLHMDNMQAYMRQMAIKGYIVDTDFSEIKSLAAELQKIDVNLRQILRHVDTMGAAYAVDTEEIRQKLNECWDIFLPKYSPDFNPIEKFWANIKNWLRLHLRDFDTFWDGLVHAFQCR